MPSEKYIQNFQSKVDNVLAFLYYPILVIIIKLKNIYIFQTFPLLSHNVLDPDMDLFVGNLKHYKYNRKSDGEKKNQKEILPFLSSSAQTRVLILLSTYISYYSTVVTE